MKYDPARLDPILYDKWLKESPKIIEGGPLELTVCDGYGEDDDAYNLESHKISSQVLDFSSSKYLYIMGFHEKFEGFKIYVNIKDKFLDRFLLMCHQFHDGPFETEDGRHFNNHPHFHQIRYFRKRSTFETETRSREARKTYEVPSSLYENMDSIRLLEAFLEHYYFDDGFDGEIKTISSDHFQTELRDFKRNG